MRLDLSLMKDCTNYPHEKVEWCRVIVVMQSHRKLFEAVLKQACFAAAFWPHQQHRQAAAQPGHEAKHHILNSLCHHQLGVGSMQITKGT